MRGDLSMEAYRVSRLFCYGRWDEGAQAHAIVGGAERHLTARDGYLAGLTLDVSATRAELTRHTVRVLLYGGEVDPMVTPALLTQAAPPFHDATVVIQPAGAHFPWVDDRAAFSARSVPSSAERAQLSESIHLSR
jgi:proline iminopeptidase